MKSYNNIKACLSFYLILLIPCSSYANKTYADANPYMPKPSLLLGTSLFQKHCSSCHGNFGLGDGPVPLANKNYPNTNLTNKKHVSSYAHKKELTRIISMGGRLSGVDKRMPAFDTTLNKIEIQSLVKFLGKWEQSPQNIRKSVQQQSTKLSPTAEIGRVIYQNHCTSCHGSSGKGDGKLLKIVQNPPPANLSTSELNDQELLGIISKGGKQFGRSPSMPPWKDELTVHQLDSVVLYIKRFREDSPKRI